MYKEHTLRNMDWTSTVLRKTVFYSYYSFIFLFPSFFLSIFSSFFFGYVYHNDVVASLHLCVYKTSVDFKCHVKIYSLSVFGDTNLNTSHIHAMKLATVKLYT
jgi:hypothetical protein